MVLPDQAIQDAIKTGDIGALRQALRDGANPNHANLMGTTLLMQCIRHHFQLGALALVEAGADIHALDDTQSDALIWSALEGDSMILELLVDAGANIHHLDEEGESAMTWAARNGLTAGVIKLLDAGMPIDAQTGAKQSTALMEAMKLQHLEAGLLLVERGANPSICDADGKSVWHYAFDHQISCLRAASQANEIAKQTPVSGLGRGSGRL